jgi:hypothetical protein
MPEARISLVDRGIVPFAIHAPADDPVGRSDWVAADAASDIFGHSLSLSFCLRQQGTLLFIYACFRPCGAKTSYERYFHSNCAASAFPDDLCRLDSGHITSARTHRNLQSGALWANLQFR